jgi:hypothetical protein
VQARDEIEETGAVGVVVFAAAAMEIIAHLDTLSEVTTTTTCAATAPALTGKAALEERAGRLTEDGLCNAVLLSEIDTVFC